MYDSDNYYNEVDNESLHSERKNSALYNKKLDRGYNIIHVKAKRRGVSYKKEVEVYTSGGTGSLIRDAETGVYYTDVVGSKNEELFFKVTMATGECTSKNGSTTLFYLSPQHFMNHQNSTLEPDIIQRWHQKSDARLTELRLQEKSKSGFVQVK